MFTKKEINQEKMVSIHSTFLGWLDSVRLNGQERKEIEDIINNLEELI